MARRHSVNPHLPALPRAVRIEDLPVNVGLRPVVDPGRNEVAVREARNHRKGLRTRRRLVDEEFLAGLAAVGIEDLAVNRVLIIVAERVAAKVCPHHDEAAVGELGDVGVSLIVGSDGVDEEFASPLDRCSHCRSSQMLVQRMLRSWAL
jgi:hypothetical protein